MRGYGSLELTVSSPAQRFVEKLSLADTQEFLQKTDDSQAVTITALIVAARVVAELHQQCDLIPKQYDLRLDSLPGYADASGGAVQLRKPLRSVDLVQRTDSDGETVEIVEGTDYMVDTARGLILPTSGHSWPSFTPYPSSSVLIRFTSGYSRNHPFWANEGAVVLQGMKFLITAWYDGRLPFLPGQSIAEYPYTVTALLGFGVPPRVF